MNPQQYLNISSSNMSDEEIISSSVNLCKIRDELVCLICHGAVYKPLECPECSTLFCRVCLRKWQKINPECPACRRDSVFQIPSRVLFNILSAESINGCPYKRCQKSQRRMSYQEIIKHFKNECEFLCGIYYSDELIDFTTDTSCHFKQVQLHECNISITSHQQPFKSLIQKKLTKLIEINHSFSTLISDGVNQKDLQIRSLRNQIYEYQQMLHDNHNLINELTQEISRLSQYENIVNEDEQMRSLVKNCQILSDGQKHASIEYFQDMIAESQLKVTNERNQVPTILQKALIIADERTKVRISKTKMIQKTKKHMK